MLAFWRDGLGVSLDAAALLRWLRSHAALAPDRIRAVLTHPVHPRGNAHPQAAASLVSNTWDPSIPDATLSSLLGFSVSQLDLLFAHAAPLLRDASLRLLQLDPRGDRLQLAFAASVRKTRSSPAVLVEEHSLWRAGKRDGWCEQSFVDSRGDHVREAVFFTAGSEAGARLRWSSRGGQTAVRVVENGQEIPAEQETLGVLFRANCAMVPLRFYFVFRDGVRRISDNNGPDLQYLARLNAAGARRWQKSGVYWVAFSPELMVHLREAFREHPVVANFCITGRWGEGGLEHR